GQNVLFRGRRARAETVALETADGAEAAGVEVLEERQLGGLAVAIAEAKIETAVDDPVTVDRNVNVVEVAQSVVLEVTARHRHFERQALRAARGGKDAAVERGARPGHAEGKVVELVAFAV